MEGKKIGYDAKRAAQNRTGLGNYSRFVVGLLQRQAGGNEYVLYVPRRGRAAHLGEVAEGAAVVSPRSLSGRLLPWLWRAVGLCGDIRRRGLDLYHGLSNELPFGIRRTGARSVVTVHDLIFIHCPQYYKPVDRLIYRLKMRYAVGAADRVVAVSEFTKRELVRLMGVPAEKVDVVYQGQQLDFAALTDADRAAARRRHRLPGRYVLYVGTIEERKNLLLVAKAMVALGSQLPDDMRVVAIGRSTDYLVSVLAYLNSYGLADRMIFLHDVDQTDLAACYQMADFFVYPSRIEGFGIPMLEAATAGIPAIGCTGSCLEEAGGEGAFYVGPDDAEEMGSCMLRLWADEALRQERSALALAHAARFDDKALADSMLRVYEKALGC